MELLMPHAARTFEARDLERLLEQHRVNGRVERDAPDRAIENLLAVTKNRRLEGHVDAVHLPVIGELFLCLGRSAIRPWRRIRLAHDAIVAIDIEAHRLESWPAHLQHFQDGSSATLFRLLANGEPAFRCCD